MNARGKSDRPIVPEKFPNKGSGAPRLADGMEERGLAKGNPRQRTRCRTQSRLDLQCALAWVRQAACKDKTPLSEATPVRHHLRQEPSAGILHAVICAGGAGKPASLPRRAVPEAPRSRSSCVSRGPGVCWSRISANGVTEWGIVCMVCLSSSSVPFWLRQPSPGKSCSS